MLTAEQIYVSYAFGAFYSNFWEEFIIDGIGTYLAIDLPQLSTRQAMLFATLSTLKSVHDHCGYSIPWHPFEMLTCQNAIYHDIHHQSWGIRVCSLGASTVALPPADTILNRLITHSFTRHFGIERLEPCGPVTLRSWTSGIVA